MKKFLIILSLVLSSSFLLTGCGGGDKDKEVVYVYSWGDYVDPEVLKIFEQETGIHVILDEFDTNESMYPRVAEGAVHYDVICPSDYMIQKLIGNDLIPMPKNISARNFSSRRSPSTRATNIQCRIAGERSG